MLNNLVGYAFTTGRVLIMSDGSPWRPLVHIEDISRAFLAALEAPLELVHDEAFNVGRSQENFQIRELADLVEEIVPDSVVEYAPGGGPDLRCYRVDCSKIEQTLPGFEPQWTARRGVRGALRRLPPLRPDRGGADERAPAADPTREGAPGRRRARRTSAAGTARLPPAEACPACGAEGLEPFYEVERVPVHSCRLVATRDEALSFPTGELRLALCPACGFIANTAYDPALQDYSVSYEETQAFSPHFRHFLRELAERWFERYELRGKRVVEIGSGKGEFLLLLHELGVGEAIGIDPGFVPGRVEERPGLRFVRELYAEHHLDLRSDAVDSRHTLEHIGPVGDFMRLVRSGLRGGEPVLFELPDVLRVLREGAFWDLYYEHVSYFSPGSLTRLFRATGFEPLVLELTTTTSTSCSRRGPGTAEPRWRSRRSRPSSPRRWRSSGA